MAGDLAGGVGDVHDLGRRGAVLAAEDAVPEPEVEGRADHDDEVAAAERLAARLGDQQRVPAGHHAAAHAVGDGGDAARTRRTAARPPRRRPPRRRCRGSARDARPTPAARRPRRPRRRRAPAPRTRATVGAGPDAELKNSSIGTSTNTGPRCEEPAAVKASCMPSMTSPAVWRVRADFAIGATIGGWSSSWRLPLPQRLAGARPPTTTIGEPANWAWAIALMPLVTPGPAVSTARPGTRVSLPVASAANAAVCSWRTSSSRIGGSALTAPSYIGNTCAPDSVNIVSTPWARATATASSPACPLIWASSVAPSSGAVSSVMAEGYSQVLTARTDRSGPGVRRGSTGWCASARRPAPSSRSERTSGGRGAMASCR